MVEASRIEKLIARGIKGNWRLCRAALISANVKAMCTPVLEAVCDSSVASIMFSHQNTWPRNGSAIRSLSGENRYCGKAPPGGMAASSALAPYWGGGLYVASK